MALAAVYLSESPIPLWVGGSSENIAIKDRHRLFPYGVVRPGFDVKATRRLLQTHYTWIATEGQDTT